MTLARHITLSDGHSMPGFGFGTYPMKGKEATEAVLTAIEAGYRLIDTAAMYGNEKEIGEAVRESGVDRDELLITTKLDNDSHGYDNAIDACKESLKKLGLEYIDLYLIHWPVEGLREETWKAFMKLKEEGLCRSIGVSNYTIKHIKELLERFDEPPVVNQVEFHPFLYQEELLEFCNEQSIVLEAYSPLAKARHLGNEVLEKIARRHDRTTAQVVLRWHLQHGVLPIPKASSRDHIKSNFEVRDFELSDDQMKAVDCLHTGERCDWDPSGAL